MKLYQSVILTGLCFIAFSSCKKTFLSEIKPENGDLTEDVIFSNKAGAESALTGIYDIFREENFNGYGSSTNNTGNLTNRGLQTDMFFFEVRGDDVFDAYYTWWRAEGSWEEGGYGRVASGSRTRQLWEMFYKAIDNANVIIGRVSTLTDATDAEKAAMIAEAKAVRGYAYFWLARVYQFTYARNPDAPGVPIYTEPTTAQTGGKPRASLKDVYDLIQSDLTEAASTLPTERVGKYRINKNVAEGMLAEVYQVLAMADPSLWQKAIDAAKAAYDGYPLMSNDEYASGFNDITNPGWIWGFPVPDNQSLSYYSIFSYMDPYYGYYRNIALNTSFVNTFSATDIRRQRFLYWGAVAGYPGLVWQTTKFTSRSTSAIQGDIVLMRSAEMHLIEAEGLAQQNKISESIDALYTIQGLRDPAAVKLSTSISKDSLINAILMERRKVLYGETGAYYFDLERYQRPLVRDGNHPYPLTVPADDPRWLFQIPTSELDANPNINDADQNP